MSIDKKNESLAAQCEYMVEEKDNLKIKTETSNASKDLRLLEHYEAGPSRETLEIDYYSHFGQKTPTKYKIPKRSASSDTKVTQSSLIKPIKSKKRKRNSFSFGDNAAFRKTDLEFGKEYSENIQPSTSYRKENTFTATRSSSPYMLLPENIEPSTSCMSDSDVGPTTGSTYTRDNAVGLPTGSQFSNDLFFEDAQPSTSYGGGNLGLAASYYSSHALSPHDYSKSTYDHLNRDQYFVNKSVSSSSKSSEDELSFEYDSEVISSKASSSKVITLGKAIKQASNRKMLKNVASFLNYRPQSLSDPSSCLGDEYDEDVSAGNVPISDPYLESEDLLYEDLEVDEACDLVEPVSREDSSDE